VTQQLQKLRCAPATNSQLKLRKPVLFFPTTIWQCFAVAQIHIPQSRATNGIVRCLPTTANGNIRWKMWKCSTPVPEILISTEPLIEEFGQLGPQMLIGRPSHVVVGRHFDSCWMISWLIDSANNWSVKIVYARDDYGISRNALVTYRGNSLATQW